MTIFRSIAWALLALLTPAQETDEPHTLSLGPGVVREPASLDDLAWLAGHWQGEGLGGRVEELWSPAQAGAMMGSFRHIDAELDEVNFYELMTLVPDGDSVVLRLKHFHADLKGWEERDEVVSFPLIKAAPDRAWFDGLTYEKVSADRLRIHLMMTSHAGGRNEVEFELRRVAD